MDISNTKFERDENNKTGTQCLESGTYMCEKHIYLEVDLNEGDIFPKCQQKGFPHNTVWCKKLT